MHAKELFYNFLSELLYLLFPANCKVCNKKLFLKEKYICNNCLSSINSIIPPYCKKCGKKIINLSIELCKECRADIKYFYKARSVCLHLQAARTLIILLKYEKKEILATTIAKIMVAHLLSYIPEYISESELIVPVPLHKSKYTERGFNQSEKIARVIAKALNKKLISNVLIKVKPTTPQVKLTRQERRRNVLDSFSINKKYKNLIIKKNLLLIDDVFTTGSTVNECSKVLMEASADRVYVYTFARGN